MKILAITLMMAFTFAISAPVNSAYACPGKASHSEKVEQASYEKDENAEKGEKAKADKKKECHGKKDRAQKADKKKDCDSKSDKATADADDE